MSIVRQNERLCGPLADNKSRREIMTEILNNFFNTCNAFLFGPIMLVVFVGTGVFLTIRLGGVQFSKFGFAMREVFGKLFKKSDDTDTGTGQIKSFSALATALSSCIGVGNIAGVASAIALGGPGAIFWMWISAIFGMATKYSEISLAMQFREQDNLGNYRGGVMYILSKGMKHKKLGKFLGGCFALFVVFVSFISCNAVQANSIAETLRVSFPNIKPYIWGVILVILAALVIFGGIRKISSVTTYLTPIMACLYVLFGIIILCINASAIPNAFKLIFVSAFKGDAIVGGIAGATMREAMKRGVSRGIFSNEAGIGSSALVHSTAKVDVPNRQALYGIAEVFVDTIIVCTFTALIVLTSPSWNSGETGVALSNLAWKGALGLFGDVVLTISVILFAFSTILGWSWYGETATTFLFGTKAIPVFRVIFLGCTFMGAVASVDVLWNAADFCNGLMSLPNLLSLWLFSGMVVKASRDFFARSEFNHLPNRGGK